MAVASGFTGLAKPLAKVVATVLILFVTTLCHIAVRPFAHPLLNWLEGAALIGEMFFSAAILARAVPAAVAPRDQNTYDILAVTVNALFLIAVAVILVDRHLEGQLGWTRALIKSKLKEAAAASPEDGDPTATRVLEERGLVEYAAAAEHTTRPAPRLLRQASPSVLLPPLPPRHASGSGTNGRRVFEAIAASGPDNPLRRPNA